MPVVSTQEIPVFEVNGVSAWGLATPTRGASEIMVWRHRIEAGQVVPPSWRDHEEILLVLEGSGVLAEGPTETPFLAGDVLIVPANTLSRITTEARTVDCVHALPSTTRHFTVTGEEMQLPWMH